MKFHLQTAVLGLGLLLAPAAGAQDTALSERAKGSDANNNGVIDRDEARGPLAGNFDTMDRNKSGGLDGAEIRCLFRGNWGAASASKPSGGAKPSGKPSKALSGRAKGMDSNKNGVIDRDEARGPLKSGFDKADKDKSGTLDGAEITAFFRSGGARRGRIATVVVDPVIRNQGSETVPVYGRLVARQMGVVAARARRGRQHSCPCRRLGQKRRAPGKAAGRHPEGGTRSQGGGTQRVQSPEGIRQSAAHAQ